MFLMHHDEQKISITSISGEDWLHGQFVIMREVRNFHFDISLNTWYSLSAKVLENNILQFEVENLTDPDNKKTRNLEIDRPIIQGGLTGFLVSYAEAVFDDLVIQGEDIPNGGTETYPVEPRQKLTKTWSILKSKQN